VAKNEARDAGEHTLREFHNEYILYSRNVTGARIDEPGCTRRDPTPTTRLIILKVQINHGRDGRHGQNRRRKF
jgi:hypothetical protein